MRFVQLKIAEGKTAFDAIQKYGCGPNFVLNREKLFRLMIKDQDLEFWFRFWLTFCFNHGCHILKAVHKQWPETTSYAFAGIHSQFIQGSDPSQYGIDIIKSMCLTKPIAKGPIINKKNAKESFNDVLQEVTEIAFGAALCEVFYKWLFASETNDKSENYWIIPKEYLYRDFQPGTLEAFLVHQWQDNLVSLFGVSLRRLPWLLKLLHGGKVKDQTAWQNDYLVFIEKITEVMRKQRDQRRMEIEMADELPRIKKKCTVGKLIVKHQRNGVIKPKLVGSKNSCVFQVKKSKRTIHECSCCLEREDIYTKFKKCRRCAAQNWKVPRYYCSDSCQFQHWCKLHEKEHIEFMARKKETIAIAKKQVALLIPKSRDDYTY